MNSVYVSTYGRGLWRLANKRHVVGNGIEDFCDRCDVVSDNGGSPSFDAVLLAFDGRILDVRREKGLVREVFVTPGTSVLFLGDENDPQDAIATGDAGDTPPSPKDRLSVGVVFTKDDTLAAPST